MGIYSKEASKQRFTGPLSCPICGHADDYDVRRQVWKLDRYITPTMARYICGKCKTPVRYEFSNRNPTGSELVKLGLIR